MASPVDIAKFSYDNELIATVGKYDQVVKIWNRLSYDMDNIDFDFSYIPHPGIVTSIRWRKPFHKEQTTENVLYTTSTDGVLRIWAPFDALDHCNFQLWLNLDLYRDNPGPLKSGKRFAFIIDNCDVSKSIESTLLRSDEKSFNKSVQNAISIAQKSPELCVVLKEDHTMTVYSIENVGQKTKTLIRLTKIAENLVLPKRFPLDSPFLSFMIFTNKQSLSNKAKDLSILVHDFRGVLLHYCAYFDKLIDQNTHKKHMVLKSVLTGHNKSIQRLIRTADGSAVLSMSRFSENYLWKTHKLDDSTILRRQSSINEENEVIRNALILRNGEFLVTLTHEKLIVWDCRETVGVPIAYKKLLFPESPKCLFLLPEAEQTIHGYHIFAIRENKQGILWRISLPVEGNTSGYDIVTHICNSELPTDDEVHIVTRVDPVGWQATIDADHIDTFQRPVIATISPEGCFRSWTASLSKTGEISWLQIAKLETDKKSISRLEVSSVNKIAIANQDATELSIWDVSNGILEFQRNFDPESPLSDLDWTTTPGSQSILAVGSASVVVFYSQLRFDYTNKTPAWAPIESIDISAYTTHTIGDSIWLSGGCLAIGAGNQLFVHDGTIDERNDYTKHIVGKHNYNYSDSVDNSYTLFYASSIMNGPLPFYHPQFLIQNIFSGNILTVKKILVVLLKALKYSVVLDSKVADIESFIGLTPEDVARFEDKDTLSSKKILFDTSHMSIDDVLDEFNTEVCNELLDWFQKVSLPYMTQHQQITLASVVEALIQVEDNSRSLDLNGIKFLLGYRLFKIHRGIQESMNIRDFNWAFHSESQEILLGLVQNPSAPLLWQAAKDTGLPYWTRTDKLRTIFETLGRNHFIHGNRDPVGCSLYYLALRKKQVLLGLWKTAASNREQAKTMKLLSNDFEQPKFKTTACKNAFALLGKHRYEYAAAFFLLGDSLKDALNVLVRNVKDVSLAIAVARVYGGDEHPAFTDLLQNVILPNAIEIGDRWMTSWAFWKLDRKDLSMQALINAPKDVVSHYNEVQIRCENFEKADSKSFLSDDPVLIVLYKQLKKKYPKFVTTPNGSDYEFQVVLKTSSIYTRMGCDLLALDLVKNWEFATADMIQVKANKSFVDQNTKSAFDEFISNGNPTSNPFGISEVYNSTPQAKKEPTPNAFGITDDFDYSSLPKAPSQTVNSFGIPDDFNYNSIKKTTPTFGLSTDKLSDKAKSTNLIDKFKVENTDKEDKDNETKVNPFANLKPAAQVAFQEPDMSAFDFGS